MATAWSVALTRAGSERLFCRGLLPSFFRRAAQHEPDVERVSARPALPLPRIAAEQLDGRQAEAIVLARQSIEAFLDRRVLCQIYVGAAVFARAKPSKSTLADSLELVKALIYRDTEHVAQEHWRDGLAAMFAQKEKNPQLLRRTHVRHQEAAQPFVVGCRQKC